MGPGAAPAPSSTFDGVLGLRIERYGDEHPSLAYALDELGEIARLGGTPSDALEPADAREHAAAAGAPGDEVRAETEAWLRGHPVGAVEAG